MSNIIIEAIDQLILEGHDFSNLSQTEQRDIEERALLLAEGDQSVLEDIEDMGAEGLYEIIDNISDEYQAQDTAMRMGF